MSRKKGTLLNAKGYPYIPAKLLRNDWRIYIEYWVYSFDKADLIRKRTSKFTGKTETEKLRDGQVRVHEINSMLSTGYMLGEKKALAKENKLNISEAFEFGLKSKNQITGNTTKGNYKSYNNIFQIYLAETQKDKLITKDFDKKEVFLFFDWLYETREIGNRTRNNYKDFLRAIFNQLIEREIISENPCKGIKKLPTISNRNIPFTDDELRILKTYLKSKTPELYIFTQFIYYGFLRPVELTRLKIKHIDIKNRIILVRPELSKNKKQMPVVIPAQLLEIIKEMKLNQYSPADFLFSKHLLPGATQLYSTRVSEMHRKVLEETGLYNSELTLYSWKHTGNCNAYRAGVDIKAIQAQNRHHSLQMTEIYLRSLGLRISSDLKNLEW